MPMRKTFPKQIIMKEIKEEVADIKTEKELAEQRRREADSEWDKAYEIQWQKECQREEDEFLERERRERESANYYEEPEPPF